MPLNSILSLDNYGDQGVYITKEYGIKEITISPQVAELRVDN